MAHPLDALDLALLEALRDHPRAGDLELSRLLSVARATVQSRLARLTEAGVVRGWSPQVSLEAAGFGVAAYVSLEIAQGALDSVREELLAIPGVVEAFVTTGTSDVLCRVAAASHAGLQDVLLDLNRSGSVVRSTSVMVLSTLIEPRVLPLLATTAAERSPRAPAYRSPT
ncbi:Lrp/AsnC family transcriptional regulator [Nocardioides aurantiacus]|uniref:AsnC family transcriptional regulator n=1 Tax=Nocardioides aurantiacus TaxID=86796 RepID=A0A3N2CZM9_9ACTN|nr:Lrp/AsnC family transcriptional regulator [Nocardioides aurantiacus]ROR92991.1 AsnC family transcriptional regulator [Nocardioides aurantiacus]